MSRIHVDPQFGPRMRTLREERDLSLRDLERPTLSSKSKLHAIETGQTQPNAETAKYIDAALNAGGELVAMVREDEPREPTVSDRELPLAGMWETAELLERVRASDVTPATVEALHVTTHELCCTYGWEDAHQLREEGLRWLREVGRLLQRPVGLHQHQELLTIAGWLALLVGCVEYDLGMRPAAEATRVAALQLAEEGGNGEIAAWAWEMSAWFALTQGHYRQVVTSAEAGQAAVGDHTAVVQLVAQEAKALGRMGDMRGVRTALERGRQLLDRFPPPVRPEHHFVVDPDKWDFYAMDAYRLVGDDDLARHHAKEILRLGAAPDGTERTPMRMAEARLTLGTLAARAGELEQAVDVATTAFVARRKSLPSLLMIAREVEHELRRRDPRGRPAAQWHEAIRELSIASGD